MSLPPKEIPLGAMRFNSESQKLEYWMGSAWMQIQTFSPTLDGGVRGIWSGGNAATPSDVIHADIEYITISTQGNSTDFGSNIVEGKRRCSGFGSRVRGFCAAGRTPSNKSTIDFVTFSSTGTTTAWGDNTSATGTADNMGFANSTRGMTKAGHQSPGATGTLDYLTMSSTGGVHDFGDLAAHGDAGAACANPTRGVLAGGYNPANDDTMSLVTIPTLGDATEFGNLTIGRYSLSACSNSIRAIWAGGQQRSPSPSTSPRNLMEFLTIPTLGNAVEFGELSVARSTASAVSSKTRGVWGGGYAPSSSDVIDYVEFATQGTAVDFGNLTVRIGGKGSAASNGHGGLG